MLQRINRMIQVVQKVQRFSLNYESYQYFSKAASNQLKSQIQAMDQSNKYCFKLIQAKVHYAVQQRDNLDDKEYLDQIMNELDDDGVFTKLSFANMNFSKYADGFKEYSQAMLFYQLLPLLISNSDKLERIALYVKLFGESTDHIYRYQKQNKDNLQRIEYHYPEAVIEAVHNYNQTTYHDYMAQLSFTQNPDKSIEHLNKAITHCELAKQQLSSLESISMDLAKLRSKTQYISSRLHEYLATIYYSKKQLELMQHHYDKALEIHQQTEGRMSIAYVNCFKAATVPRIQVQPEEVMQMWEELYEEAYHHSDKQVTYLVSLSYFCICQILKINCDEIYAHCEQLLEQYTDWNQEASEYHRLATKYCLRKPDYDGVVKHINKIMDHLAELEPIQWAKNLIQLSNLIGTLPSNNENKKLLLIKVLNSLETCPFRWEQIDPATLNPMDKEILFHCELTIAVLNFKIHDDYTALNQFIGYYAADNEISTQFIDVLQNICNNLKASNRKQEFLTYQQLIIQLVEQAPEKYKHIDINKLRQNMN